MSKKLFRPDMDNLMGEWCDHPDLTHDLSRRAAKKDADLGIAKEQMDLVEALTKLELVRKPEKFGFESKPTEKIIEATVISTEKFKKAQREYLDAKLERELAEAAVKAASAKKSALENLVILYMREAGSAPKVKPEHTEKAKDMIRNSNKYNKLPDQKGKKK